ncbi:hypothetical protein AVEN_182806-1 [Araneus ventricosus]|uniref:Uncharacterized protein n=1 Tax=Araneus ventricosus TaxID=182803 RepID=A0A4Y2JH47_ARAVE|nr:hypothetical protein AVEN_182806-1 [Araneus ventricosus]
MFTKATANLEPQDLIRLVLMSEQTYLMRVSDMSVESFLGRVLHVLQSKEEVKLDEAFTVNNVIIRRPVGGGRNRRVFIPEEDRIRKSSVIHITNKDDLNVCCAKAILLGKAFLENDPQLNTLRKQSCDLLTRKALPRYSMSHRGISAH